MNLSIFKPCKKRAGRGKLPARPVSKLPATVAGIERRALFERGALTLAPIATRQRERAAQARIGGAEVSFPANPKERAAVSNGPPCQQTQPKRRGRFTARNLSPLR